MKNFRPSDGKDHFPRAAWRRKRIHFMMKAHGKIDGVPYYVLTGYRQPWKKAR